MPVSDCNETGLAEDCVTEEQYNYLYAELHNKLGQYDEYLEVFDDSMQYSEAPVVNSIAEKVCDIYQDLKNFTFSYRSGMPEIIEEAIWELNNNFELYCANPVSLQSETGNKLPFK